ncbi:hypothetical protein AL060_05235 [Pseudomonas syringae pv. rhaphiolepidis]|nr:hypothetical protein AL060_05235 [Pseudomonas syringae pv. rhaphiolepidis]
MLFGLPPGAPSASQLAEIKLAIARAQLNGHTPSKAEWEKAVRANCPDVGQASYSGVDNSSLKALLAVAIKNAQENKNAKESKK